MRFLNFLVAQSEKKHARENNILATLGMKAQCHDYLNMR